MSLPHMKIKCSGQFTERIEKQRERKSCFLFTSIFLKARKVGIIKIFGKQAKILPLAAFSKRFFVVLILTFFSHRCFTYLNVFGNYFDRLNHI